jgi:stage II sporulation protein R
VSVSLGAESYPTRGYEGFSLPAGEYESLRISLGDGAGQNWWCIVFPPVCLSAVQSEPVAAAMNKTDYALVSSQEGWELRFKTVELWGQLKAKLDE